MTVDRSVNTYGSKDVDREAATASASGCYARSGGSNRSRGRRQCRSGKPRKNTRKSWNEAEDVAEE